MHRGRIARHGSAAIKRRWRLQVGDEGRSLFV
jgi:hypothetical protein